MKLHIEVELTQDEIPLAEELFKTLRSLTDHVRTRNTGPLLRALIKRLEDPSQLDAVAEELRPLIGLDETTLGEFLDQFLSVIFDPDLLLHEKSVAPYMYILPRLPEQAQAKARDVLISTVLKHLTEKRPVEASRLEFFAQAEAFAVLVNLGFFATAGAMTTIIRLLRRTDNRCAAMTMLGKTVEHCLPQLLTCDPALLQDLHSVLRTVKEDVFQYDINYIEDSLGWTDAAPTRDPPISLPDSLPGSSGLRAVNSLCGHGSTIFSLAYDSLRCEVISASLDSTILMWGERGEKAESVDLHHYYACSLDVNPQQTTMFVAGVGMKADVFRPPLLLLYTPSGRGWKEVGRIVRDTSQIVRCIKGLAEGNGHAFVTGETLAGPHGKEVVCCYDTPTLSSSSSTRPVRQYAEHDELITCLSLAPPNPTSFLTGSQDCSVRVWDKRADRSVGAFGTPSPAHGGRVVAHANIVTCVECVDTDMVLTGGVDLVVKRWDMRQYGAPVSFLQMDDKAVLNVAVGGGPHCSAISTSRALYMVDWGGPRPVSRLAEPFTDGRTMGRYHGLKWGTGRNVLYAGGDEKRVDVYMYS